MGDSSLASTDNDTTMTRSSLNIPHTTSSIISNGEKGGPPNSNGGPPINPIEHDDRFNYGECCFFKEMIVCFCCNCKSYLINVSHNIQPSCLPCILSKVFLW